MNKTTENEGKIGLLIVTHGRLGHCLADTVSEMIGPLPLDVNIVEVRSNEDPARMIQATLTAARELDQNAGILLLTDAFGSTPSNIAVRSASQLPAARVVAGLNLPMLIRIFNYPDLDLDAMVDSAIDGGRQGILSTD